MLKTSYAIEMYNRIDEYIQKEEPKKPSSGLLSRESAMRTNMKNNEPINFVADTVQAIRRRKQQI